jgi:opacity protein-like surface antigen
MRRRLALVVAAALLSLPLVASAASAQAHVRIGGFLGFEFDFEEDWLIFGAEARLRGARTHFDIQPRFHYQSFEGGSSIQLDGNLLFNLTSPVAQVQPYMGAGVAINRFSFDVPDIPGQPDLDSDDTNVGLNLISGLIFGTNPKWRPYVNFQYTSILDFANGANISAGILWRLSGSYR